MTTEKNDSHLPVPSSEGARSPRGTVITPEIVDDSAQGGQKHEAFYSQTTQGGGTRFTYTSWTGGAGGAGGTGFGSGGLVARDGCLPAMITLLLTVACAVQFGILSAISFVVFYAVASGVGFMIRLRNLMEGRAIDPWVFRIVAWGGAMLLVTWLS